MDEHTPSTTNLYTIEDFHSDMVRSLMRIFRRAFRPHCLGLFVEGGVLYAQRDMSDPAFRTLITAQERRDFLNPVPIDLSNARVFLDIEVGKRRPLDYPLGTNVFRPPYPPDNPRKLTSKLYTVSIHTDTSDVYIGYPATGGEARNIFRAIEKLVQSGRSDNESEH